VINGLDLFSGIGGISIGLSRWVEPIAYCENDRFSQSDLLDNMHNGHIKMAPIWDDVRTLKGKDLPVMPDIVYGGFPCQDISTAGLGAGLDGQRSGLYFEIVRLVEETKPTFVFLENVAAIRTRGLSRVCYELAARGYDLRWTVISASSVGACHQRARWFLLAHTDCESSRKQLFNQFDKSKNGVVSARKKGIDTHTHSTRRERYGRTFGNESKITKPVGFGRWTSEPAIRRGDHGLQNRPHELKSLGNSVVPYQVEKAFETLIGFRATA
jgi:DNA (cytosine-5)-methyltransferase 1